jgi:hypothetical protein
MPFILFYITQKWWQWKRKHSEKSLESSHMVFYKSPRLSPSSLALHISNKIWVSLSISHKYCVSMDLVHTCPRWHRFLAYTATGEVDSAFHAIWLVAQLRISLHYSPPDKNQMAFHFVPVYTDYYESWNTDYFKTIFRIFVVFWSFLFWCGIC